MKILNHGLIFFHRHKIIHILMSVSKVVFFKECVDFISIVKFIGLNVCWHLVNACRICSDIPLFAPDIDHLYILFVFAVLPEIYQPTLIISSKNWCMVLLIFFIISYFFPLPCSSLFLFLFSFFYFGGTLIHLAFGFLRLKFRLLILIFLHF